MAEPYRQYTDEIFDKLRYWATWLPTARIRLGDCGRVRNRVFEPETSLERLGVTFEETEETEPLEIAHRSQQGVEYQLQLAAGNQSIPEVPQGKAGLEVAFERENGVVLVVRRGRERRIEDVDTLRRDVLQAVEQGKLRREYAVVTHIVEADSASVLISSGASGRFVVSAEADLRAGLAELANAQAGFTRLVSRNLGTELIAERGLTPLFKLVGFKRGGLFWGSPRVVQLGYAADDEPGELEELAPSESDADETSE